MASADVARRRRRTGYFAILEISIEFQLSGVEPWTGSRRLRRPVRYLPDIILLDMMMPEKTSAGLAARSASARPRRAFHHPADGAG